HRDRLPEFIDSLIEPLNKALVRLTGSKLPVVNVVQGPVGGSGIALALCGDFVIAAASMKLRGGYSALALTPDIGTSWFLTNRTGAARAKQLFLLNETLNPQQCLDRGIVDAIYPNTELESHSNELAERLRAGPRAVFARIKTLVDTAHERDLERHLELERRYMVDRSEERR